MTTTYGGAEIHTERLSDLLRHDFELYHWVAGTRLFASLAGRYDHVFRNPHPANRHYLKNRRRLLELVREHRIELVVLNGDREQLYAPWVGRIAKTVVVTHMDIFHATLAKRGLRIAGIRQFAKNLVYAATGIFAHGLVCVSAPLADAWRRVPGVRATVTTIPNWPPADFLSAPPSRRPVPGAPFHVLIVGRLIRQKGHLDLLSACRGLDGVRIHVVGEGPDAAVFQAAATGLDVKFYGYVEDPLPYYRYSDVVVLPSYSEGHPLSLIEAMSLAVPCIATGLPGIRRMITAPREGLLVAPGDIPGLRTAIVFLKTHPEARRRMGAAARARILATQGPQSAHRAYLEAFSAVLTT